MLCHGRATSDDIVRSRTVTYGLNRVPTMVSVYQQTMVMKSYNLIRCRTIPIRLSQLSSCLRLLRCVTNPSFVMWPQSSDCNMVVGVRDSHRYLEFYSIARRHSSVWPRLYEIHQLKYILLPSQFQAESVALYCLIDYIHAIWISIINYDGPSHSNVIFWPHSHWLRMIYLHHL